MRKHLKECKSINVNHLNDWLANRVQSPDFIAHQGAIKSTSISATQYVKRAISFYRDYFGVPQVGEHFIGKPDYFARGRIKPGKNKKDFVKHSQKNYVPIITDLHLFKHFLSATGDIHRKLALWIHLYIEPTTNFLIIDRDYHKGGVFKKSEITTNIKKDYDKLVALFGVPSLVVTSRSGAPGCNYYYKLDKEYPNELVKAFVADKGLVEKRGEWDIFPRGVGSAYTALPFGMNSKIVVNGAIQPELGLMAMLKWYANVNSASILSLKNFKLSKKSSRIVKQNKSISSGESFELKTALHSKGNLSPMTLGAIKVLIDELFSNPKSFKRNFAQQLLKYHTQKFNDMSVPASIEFAWNWMTENLESTDIKFNTEWAYDNLKVFYSKRLISSNNLKIKYELGSSQIRAILIDLIASHSKICNLTNVNNKRQNKSILAVYSLYLFLHAEHQRQKVIGDTFQIKTIRMKKWQGCSEARYKKALLVLEDANLILFDLGHCSYDKNGNIRSNGNFLTLKGKPIHLNEEKKVLDDKTIESIFLTQLPEIIGVDLYGKSGYYKRRDKLSRLKNSKTGK